MVLFLQVLNDCFVVLSCVVLLPNKIDDDIFRMHDTFDWCRYHDCCPCVLCCVNVNVMCCVSVGCV